MDGNPILNFPLNADRTVYHLNLQTKHINEVVIIVSEPSQVFQVSQNFDSVEYEMNKGEFITHIGKYKKHKITVISTGMGTDNTETLLTELDLLVNVDLKKKQIRSPLKKINILKLGTTTAIQEDMQLGGFYITEYALGLDNVLNFYNLEQSGHCKEVSEKFQKECGLDFLPYTATASTPLLKKFSSVFQKGNTITTPGFYAPQGKKIRLPLKYPKLIEHFTFFHFEDLWFNTMDMETSTFYGLCQLFGHNAISINAIIADQLNDKFAEDHNKIFGSLARKVLEAL